MIQQDMVISPRLSLRGSDDMYRIVLTWGRSPKDLDSYVITPWPRDAECQSGMVGCTITGGLHVELEIENRKEILSAARQILALYPTICLSMYRTKRTLGVRGGYTPNLRFQSMFRVT